MIIIIGLIALILASINAYTKGDDSMESVAIIGGIIILIWLLCLSV